MLYHISADDGLRISKEKKKIAEKVTLHDEIPFKLIHQISEQVIILNLIRQDSSSGGIIIRVRCFSP